MTQLRGRSPLCKAEKQRDLKTVTSLDKIRNDIRELKVELNTRFSFPLISVLILPHTLDGTRWEPHLSDKAGAPNDSFLYISSEKQIFPRISYYLRTAKTF